MQFKKNLYTFFMTFLRLEKTSLIQLVKLVVTMPTSLRLIGTIGLLNCSLLEIIVIRISISLIVTFLNF
jgi:hypothetical protein